MAATNVDLEKYKNDGWGLSFKALTGLIAAMDSLPEVKAIEFGSGFSTEFLLDYANVSNKDMSIDSFDNDKKYKHKDAVLAPLIQCNDRNYQKMFEQEEIDWSLFKKRWWRPKTRQKNCVYNISDFNFKDDYNLAIIDGPHGNGRNFAYLLLKNKMKSGYLFIDDFNHYDFVETASKLFDLEEITRVEAPKDNFILLKIKEKV